MKAIQPVNIWINGEQKVANQFNLRIIADDLSSSATFYYELINQTTPAEGDDPINTVLANGNSSLSGEEYDTWDESSDVNNEAYVLIAAKLNLTLIS
jgi:hypothetical protein